MTTLLSHSVRETEGARLLDARDIADARALNARAEARLRRFRSKARAGVRALAMKHSRLADLAFSFPALLFALAHPRRGVDAHAAVEAAIAGDNLARLAHLAGVPVWLRKLPPEAFETPLPALPDGPDIRRRIANHFPDKWSRGPQWIEGVANMARWAGDEAALWLAREMSREWSLPTGRREINEWRLLALWIWHSQHGAGRARDLIASPFAAAMSFDAGANAAYDFRDNLELYMNLGDSAAPDPWFEEREVDGFAFTALTSFAAISEEARGMRHCVRRYGEDVAYNRCRLFSITKDGQRVATVRIAFPYRHPLPQIVELEGHANAPADKAVWLAARRWLDGHDLMALHVEPIGYDGLAFRQADWMALWRPYWLAMKRIPPWLPLRGSRHALHGL